MGCGRILDYVFSCFFAMHIPIAIVCDSRMIVHESMYPEWAKTFSNWYATTYRDPFILERPPVWLQSFIYLEFILQFPCFPLFAYAFAKGGCRWLRTPIIIYGTNTCTMLFAIISHIMLHDFNKDPKPVGPRNIEEKLFLLSAFAPFFIFPFIMLVRMVLDKDYGGKVKKE